MLSMLLGLMACQPSNKQHQESQAPTPSALEAAQPSAITLAVITKFQSEYVTQVLNLQNSLQAEHEALQSADVPMEKSEAVKYTNLATDKNISKNVTVKSLEDVKNDVIENTQNIENIQNENNNNDNNQAQAKSSAQTLDDKTSTIALTDAPITRPSADTDLTFSVPAKPEISVKEALSEQKQSDHREQLPLANTVIAPPEILTTAQIEARYQQAMQALYTSDKTPLSSETVDTLLSIAMLIPDVFQNEDLANRLTLKMPSLARLLQQYQIWEQIEAQQSIELQAIKQAQIKAQQEQQQNFEKLMAEFNQTIESYDDQIGKYEQKLKEFE